MEDARWGPDPQTVGLVAVHGRADVDDVPGFVASLRAVGERLGAPLQALGAGRVLSWVHLVMAADHARRAMASGRARGKDPAVEFAVYAAGDRQIQRALDAVGVARGTGVPVWVVALGPVEVGALKAALAQVGLQTGAHWTARDHGAKVEDQDDARASWTTQLGLPVTSTEREVEDALLSRMALLALAKA